MIFYIYRQRSIIIPFISLSKNICSILVRSNNVWPENFSSLWYKVEAEQNWNLLKICCEQSWKSGSEREGGTKCLLTKRMWNKWLHEPAVLDLFAVTWFWVSHILSEYINYCLFFLTLFLPVLPIRHSTLNWINENRAETSTFVTEKRKRKTKTPKPSIFRLK